MECCVLITPWGVLALCNVFESQNLLQGLNPASSMRKTASDLGLRRRMRWTWSHLGYRCMTWVASHGRGSTYTLLVANCSTDYTAEVSISWAQSHSWRLCTGPNGNWPLEATPLYVHVSLCLGLVSSNILQFYQSFQPLVSHNSALNLILNHRKGDDKHNYIPSITCQNRQACYQVKTQQFFHIFLISICTSVWTKLPNNLMNVIYHGLTKYLPWSPTNIIIVFWAKPCWSRLWSSFPTMSSI